MARTQTMVQLTDELVERLDSEAERRGVSRSALIRDILTEGLGDEYDHQLAAQIAEAFRRQPAGLPDEWGVLEEDTKILSAEAARRLEEDEEAAGHPRW